MALDFERAMQNPAAHFSTPGDVLTRAGLSPQQRAALLRQWEYDARQLEVATEENMAPSADTGTRLREIHRALETLGVSGESNPAVNKGG